MTVLAIVCRCEGCLDLRADLWPLSPAAECETRRVLLLQCLIQAALWVLVMQTFHCKWVSILVPIFFVAMTVFAFLQLVQHHRKNSIYQGNYELLISLK